MKITMKGCLAGSLFVLLFGDLRAQNQNALDFDGLDDEVIVTNASALIAGSSQISLTCWVYPTNPAPNFPDFDGFAGIRNNTDADFYLLHYTATSVEARFRNSAGTVFDIVSQGLQLNTWQHYALTYDGAMLRVFLNGLPADSVPASGTINSSVESLHIGSQLFGFTNYYLAGRMDEVSLWNVSLTNDDVDCIYKGAIDTAATGLLLYYRFNQGVAGGNNLAVNTLADAKNNINGTLMNFGLSGSSSNWIQGVQNFTQDSASICPGDTFLFNGQALTGAGIYTAHFTTAFVCDSVVELSLSVVDTSVTLNGVQLLASQAGASYQWVRCDSGYAPVTGATGQGFTPVTGGSYAVVLSMGGCTDTSQCHAYSLTGIAGQGVLEELFIYPNPATGFFTVESPNRPAWTLTIWDLADRVLYRESHRGREAQIDASAWNQWISQLERTDDKTTVRRMLEKL